MSAVRWLHAAPLPGPSGRGTSSDSDPFLLKKRKENISSFKSNKVRWIHADVFHRKLILKGARHGSKSHDSARHFYSDKLHHKDKWKRRNYCSGLGPIAATKQWTSSLLLLYHE